MKENHMFLVRGLIREKEHWGTFLSNLENSFPSIQFHTLEIPGNGVYFKDKTPLSIEEIVRFMRIDFLKLKGKSNSILATSLGGMIAIEWIRQFPEDFSKAVLINTSVGGFSLFYKRLKLNNILRLIKIALSRDEIEKEKLIIEMISNFPDKYEETSILRAKIQKERPVSLRNSVIQLWAAAIYSAPKKPPSIPVMLLNSINDKMVDTSCSTALHNSWNIPIYYNEKAGHDMILDTPEWVIEKLKEWN